MTQSKRHPTPVQQLAPVGVIERRILLVRGLKVILDTDLASG